MVVFIGYHATSRRNRQSIQERGLIPGDLSEPKGVYVFDPYMDNGFTASTAQKCGWDSGPDQDLWQVAYSGPMRRDNCLCNAVILPPVPVVTLVTGNS